VNIQDKVLPDSLKERIRDSRDVARNPYATGEAEIHAYADTPLTRAAAADAYSNGLLHATVLLTGRDVEDVLREVTE